MKQRLPLLSDRGPSRTSPGASNPPAARLVATRSLVCIAGDAGDAGEQSAVGFACSLVATLHQHGRLVAVLLPTATGQKSLGAADALKGAGAQSVALVLEAELPDAATHALEALPSGTIAVAVGARLAEQLKGLLAVWVGADPRKGIREARSGELFDLHLGRDSDGVAILLAHWLALHAKG